MKIMLGILASAALAALVGTGLYLRFGLQALDRPGMENPAGPMLELLNADWMSDDGVWSARIEGATLDLSYRQELVYSGGFSFDFQGDGLNAKTELSFDDKQFESEDGSVLYYGESLCGKPQAISGHHRFKSRGSQRAAADGPEPGRER